MIISVWLLAMSLDSYVLASSYFHDHGCQNISGDCSCNAETYKGIIFKKNLLTTVIVTKKEISDLLNNYYDIFYNIP